MPTSDEPRWLTLPETPGLPAPDTTGTVPTDGAQIWFATFGQSGPFVTLLHGGLANSNYWGHQARALSANYRVIVIDSRGHGRSTNESQTYSYAQMARDALSVLDHLEIERTAIVGWSDGAITGLLLAIGQRERLTGLFAFAGNYNTSGLYDTSTNPIFNAYFQRTVQEYEKLSPTPSKYVDLLTGIATMWKTQPDIQPAELQTIQVPVWVVDGDRDEVVKRPHIEELAGFIPDAGLLIQPQVSHFAFLQAPDQFNDAVKQFLEGLDERSVDQAR